ncbi:Pentatricopeptide repeat-containing protein [Sesamum angolense]|uniref:Pentatricopeptide repeat-containing protein n=1 Tax=Sesamum angolense TaxID=2727404 RepID=A0AAE1XF34_9LAMI|nr:Pentatricopeptide repeat-containing protein [Sesamum angolense]
MSKAILSLIKPLHRPQPKSSRKFLITPHIKELANEVCEILRTQGQQWEETLQNRFFEEDIAPSEVAHLVFDKVRDCEMGLKFFDFVSQNRFSLDGFAYSSLLKLLARSKVFAEIDNVLLECMQSEEKLPTREALSFVIRAYAESGLVSKALELYSFVLKTYNALPQLLACNSLLNGLIQDGNMEAAWCVYDEMVRRDDGGENSCFNNYSVCIMVKGLCKEGKVMKGKRLIEKRWGKNCIPNIVFYNTLIDGYCKRGDVKRAHKLLEDLKEKGFLPTQETYGAIINGFCKRGEFEKVDQILKEMDSRGMEVNAQVYNCVIDAKLKCGLVGEALETTRKMIEVGCKLDIVTYNTLISNACRDGKVQEAERLLEKALNSRLVLNKLSFTPLIHVYSREGDFERASILLVQMTECGLKPDLITYGGLIHGLVVAGEVDAALTIRQKMMERGESPDACIYNVLMNGLCKKGAEKILKGLQLDGVAPNVVTYTVLIVNGLSNNAPCAISRTDTESRLDKPMLLDIFGRMISDGWRPISAAYVSIIACLCLNRMLGAALQLTDKMLNKGFPLDSVTLAALLHGVCSVGKAKEWRNIIPSKLIEPKLNVALNEESHGIGQNWQAVTRAPLLVVVQEVTVSQGRDSVEGSYPQSCYMPEKPFSPSSNIRYQNTPKDTVLKDGTLPFMENLRSIIMSGWIIFQIMGYNLSTGLLSSCGAAYWLEAEE